MRARYRVNSDGLVAKDVIRGLLETDLADTKRLLIIRSLNGKDLIRVTVTSTVSGAL